MRNRRKFLKDVVGAAGMVFVGCGLDDGVAQSAQPGAAGKHAPIMVRGRRIRTVDVHAHCAFVRTAAILGRQLVNDTLLLEGQALAQRIKDMDAQGIDIAVLSINPNWYATDRDIASQIVNVQNEGMAQFCSTHSDRFAAFASVALQFPDLAIQQLEQATKKMGLRGVAVGVNVAGLELADAKFNPFWAKCEELGATVFIHPQPMPELRNRLKGNGALGNVISNPLETTIALSHLIFEGTLDRYPKLKVLAAHGGGYLPSYMNRSDHGCLVFPTRCTPGVPKRKPTEYIKQMYYDSLVFTSEALRHLVAEVGASQIVVGTDYPYPWMNTAIEHVLNTPGLSDDDKVAILEGTATKLLGLARAER